MLACWFIHPQNKGPYKGSEAPMHTLDMVTCVLMCALRIPPLFWGGGLPALHILWYTPQTGIVPLCKAELPRDLAPPPPLARAMVKALKMTETMPPVVLTGTLRTCTLRRHEQ